MPGNKDIIQFGITQKVSLSDQIEIAFNHFEREGLGGCPWGKMYISGIFSKFVFCFTLFQEQVCTCTNLLVLYVGVHSMTYVPSLYRIILIVISFIFDHSLSQDFTYPDDQTTLSKNVYVKNM